MSLAADADEADAWEADVGEPDAWEADVERFWATADDADPERVLAEVRALVARRPAGDAAAAFELASGFDFVGREAEAIPGYEAAIAAGLDEPRRSSAVIQLASSLRIVGEPVRALAVLDGDAVGGPVVASLAPAASAFRALVLHDLGRHDEALAVALTALAPTLPAYARSVSWYAGELGRPGVAGSGDAPEGPSGR